MPIDPFARFDVPAGGPADALRRLVAGNERFQGGQRTRAYPPHQGPFAGRQEPFAAILACADSRTAPEDVFDEGLGQLFVCRVAGNTAADVVTGSLEYAVDHLHVALVAVVGHSGCGACSATLESLVLGVLPGGSLEAVVRAILPATGAVDRHLAPPDQLTQLVTANAAGTAGTLAMNAVLYRAQRARTVAVVWGIHDLESGRVDWGGASAG